MSKITSKQLVETFKKCLAEGWGYVYGAQGETYTKSLAEKWRDAGRPVPNSGWDRKTYFTVDCAKWFGHRVADCSGGIVWTIQQYNPTFKDRTADTFKSQFTQSGTIDTLPEIHGLAVWRKGHIGVYIGNGYAIEFRGTNYGCVQTAVKDRDWTHWGKIDGVNYNTAQTTTNNSKGDFNMTMNNVKSGSTGASVKALQILLNGNGYDCGKADGIAGTKTVSAIKAYQGKNGLTADGIAGEKTWAKILKGE